jgi:hypothetical protein
MVQAISVVGTDHDMTTAQRRSGRETTSTGSRSPMRTITAFRAGARDRLVEVLSPQSGRAHTKYTDSYE